MIVNQNITNKVKYLDLDIPEAESVIYFGFNGELYEWDNVEEEWIKLEFVRRGQNKENGISHPNPCP